MPHRRQLVWISTAIGALALAANCCLAQTSPPADAPLREIPQEQAEQADQPQAPGQPATQPSEGQEPTGRPSLFKGNYLLFVMIGGIVLLYIWMGRGRRKKETQRKEMLASLKKGDKVTSIGGVVGTVIEVREDEVTVKVDETNNIRMRFARWAIRGVGEGAKHEGPEDRK